MIPTDIFDRFAKDSPITVMVQAIMENVFPPRLVNSLFSQYARFQYTRTLLFSDVVLLMTLVVCRIRPSINSAFKKMQAVLNVTRKAVYDKIDHVEPQISAALLAHSADACAPIIDHLLPNSAPWVPKYRTRILDGNHLAATEHRLKPLRDTAAGPLPGFALVVYDPQRKLVTDVLLNEDGHAQERSMTKAILDLVQVGDLWIGDRNFCTSALLFGIAGRGAVFVTRQHAANVRWEAAGERICRGRCETGEVFEQAVIFTNDDGDNLKARRITVELDAATRDGDRTIHILTNAPEEDLDAVEGARVYRKRWSLETAFQELEASLNGEMATLGQPKAALFAFCLSLAAYNVLSVVKASLESAHGEAGSEEQISGRDLAEEVSGTYRGMMIAIPEDEWGVFHGLSAYEMSEFLKEVAQRVRLREFRKQKRGKKKPRPAREQVPKIKHVSTAKRLAEEKQRKA